MSKTMQLLEDLDYLQTAGMTEDHLRSLHHWAGRTGAEERVTFKSAREYFGQGREMRANNAAFAERLHFVADAHKRDMSTLVELALRVHPM